MNKITKEMEKYNYFYDNQPITKERFLLEAPENWKIDVDDNGEYSFGYYRAVEIT